MQQRLPSCLIALIFTHLDDIDEIYYLTVSLIPAWLEYVMDLYNDKRRASWNWTHRQPWINLGVTDGQIRLYSNGYHTLLRQEIHRRGPHFGLFHQINPYLDDPHHRYLHQFILEQCEMHYAKKPFTSNEVKYRGVGYALEAATTDYGGDIAIIKLQCVLPLYTRSVVQNLLWLAITKDRIDIVRYLRTMENYCPEVPTIMCAIREHRHAMAILLRGSMQSFRQGHFVWRPYKMELCKQPGTCDCLGGWGTPTLKDWERWEKIYSVPSSDAQ